MFELTYVINGIELSTC